MSNQRAANGASGRRRVGGRAAGQGRGRCAGGARSSAAEQEELARQIARLFGDDMLSAVEATVHRAFLRLGTSPDK